jgi:hypothetical protein
MVDVADNIADTDAPLGMFRLASNEVQNETVYDCKMRNALTKCELLLFCLLAFQIKQNSHTSCENL